jgi:transcriptional regulator with XRE-family HTH domain
VITGEQIRRARELLGWTRFKLSSRAALHPAIVERAENAVAALPVTTSRPYCGTLLKPPASSSPTAMSRA